MERFWQDVSRSPEPSFTQCPTNLDLCKERIRRRIRHNKHARFRETPSKAEIVVGIAALIMVFAVCVQAISR